MGISLVTGLLSAAGAAIAAGGMTLGAFVATTAAFTALGAVSKALLPKAEIPTLNAGQSGTTVSSKNSIATRRLIYGRTRVGGTIVFSGSGGTNNEFLYHAYALADTAYTEYDSSDPVAALDNIYQIYFDDELVATRTGSNVYTYESNWAGTSATTSPYISIMFYDGSQTAHDPTLYSAFTPQWTTSHKLQGIAYVMLRLEYDQDKFPNGMPNVSFVVDGRRVYDPRKDSTSDIYDSNLGVSSHRENKPDTWALSNNPALCLLDYMRDPVYGLGESMDNFDLDALETCINTCDDDVPLLSTTQKRYTCDGVIDSGNKLATNIENILSAMAGKLYYSSGKFSMFAIGGDLDSGGNPINVKPVESTVIDEDMMIGAVSLRTKTSRRNQYNTVKGQFNNEDQNYIATDYPPRDSSVYIGSDGEALVLNVDLPLTTNHYRAQRIAHLTLQKSRQQATIDLKLNLTALRFRVGDNVKVSYSKFGYVEKVFEIQKLQVIPDAEAGVHVAITAVEDDPNEFVYDTSSAIDVPATLGVTSYDGTTVSAPNSIDADFAVVSDFSTNTTPKIKIFIDDNPSPFITHYQLYIYMIPNSNATGHEEYLVDAQEFTLTRDFGFRVMHLVDLVDRRAGLFRVTCQAVNINGIYSDVVSAEFEITEEFRREILLPDLIPAIVVQQTDPLTEPTDEQITLANKGSDPVQGDEIIYQQVDDQGIVIDSVVYNYAEDIQVRMARSFQARNSDFPHDRLLVDLIFTGNYSFGTNETNTYTVVEVDQGGLQAFADVGTATVYKTASDIEALDNTIVNNELMYPNGEMELFAGFMIPSFNYVVVRFEIDTANIGAGLTIHDRYRLRVTNGSQTIQSTQFSVMFISR